MKSSQARRLMFEFLESRQVLSLLLGGGDDLEVGPAKGRPTTSGPQFDLPTVVAHEVGHALGLPHSTSGDCGTANQPIMCPYYIGPAFRLMGEDVAKIDSLYPDASIATNSTDNRWDNPNITFSFVPDGTRLESAAKGSELFAKLQKSIGENWKSVFRQALNLWAEATDHGGVPDLDPTDNALRFTEVEDGGQAFDFAGLSQGDSRVGDIRFGAHKFDSPGGVLAHAYYPPPNGITAAGDAHFASEENWSNLAHLTLSSSTSPLGTGGGSGNLSVSRSPLRRADAQFQDLALVALLTAPLTPPISALPSSATIVSDPEPQSTAAPDCDWNTATSGNDEAHQLGERDSAESDGREESALDEFLIQTAYLG